MQKSLIDFLKKNKDPQKEQEMMNKINNKYSELVSLADHKIQIVDEQIYRNLCFLKKLDETIENYEKYVQANNLTQALNPSVYTDYRGEKAISQISDELSVQGSKE